MANPASDTFVEGGGDVNLTAHTPTGSNPGTSWDVLVAGGSILLVAATDLVQDNSGANGNRYRMTDDLTSDEHDVQADVTIVSGAANVFGGVMGRVPNSGTGTTGWEFQYDYSGSQWQLTDGTTTINTSEAAPVGAKTYKLSCRNSGQTGYVDGVSKCTTASNTKTGNTRGGILLGNFSSTANRLSADNYVSQAAVAATSRPRLKRMTLMGVN